MDTGLEQAASSAEASEAQGAQGYQANATLSDLEADALNGKPSEPRQTEQTFEIKIDGKTQKVSLDELKKGYSLESAARKRMEEAASFKKENDYLRNMLKTVKDDPTKFVDLGRALGIDVDELAIQIALKKAKYEMMEPHERELHDYKEEVEKLRREQEKHESSSKKQEYERHYDSAASELHDQIQSQCQALGLNPAKSQADRSLIHAAVQIIYDNFDEQSGSSRVTLERALKHVKKQRESERQEYLSSIENLPPDVIEQVRKRSVTDFKQSKMQPPRQQQSPQRRQAQQPLNVDDYFKQKELLFKKRG